MAEWKALAQIWERELAAKRRAEGQDSGQSSTGYLQPGDLLRMEMKGISGASLFGTIEQGVADSLPVP